MTVCITYKLFLKEKTSFISSPGTNVTVGTLNFGSQQSGRGGCTLCTH